MSAPHDLFVELAALQRDLGDAASLAMQQRFAMIGATSHDPLAFQKLLCERLDGLAAAAVTLSRSIEANHVSIYFPEEAETTEAGPWQQTTETDANAS